MVDYFEERIKAKKERVSKNEMQRLRNIAHSHSYISSANATPLGVSTDLNNRTRREVQISAIFLQLDVLVPEGPDPARSRRHKAARGTWAFYVGIWPILPSLFLSELIFLVWPTSLLLLDVSFFDSGL